MNNVFRLTIMAEGSDGQCIWSDYCQEGRGGQIAVNDSDCLICTSQACISTMMTLRFCNQGNKNNCDEVTINFVKQ